MTGPRGLGVNLNFPRGFATHGWACGSDWACRTCPWLFEGEGCASEQPGAMCEEGVFPQYIEVVRGASGRTRRYGDPSSPIRGPSPLLSNGPVGAARMPGGLLTEAIDGTGLAPAGCHCPQAPVRWQTPCSSAHPFGPEVTHSESSGSLFFTTSFPP